MTIKLPLPISDNFGVASRSWQKTTRFPSFPRRREPSESRQRHPRKLGSRLRGNDDLVTRILRDHRIFTWDKLLKSLLACLLFLTIPACSIAAETEDSKPEVPKPKVDESILTVDRIYGGSEFKAESFG